MVLEHTISIDTVSPIPPQHEVAHSWLDVNGDGKLEDISSDPQTWITSMSPNMMYASAIDLARWSEALYGGQVLSATSLAQILTFHRPTPNEPPITGYGLGTEEIAVKNLIQSYGHLGFHYGNMSAMLYFPKLKTSLVVLTNENNPPFQYGVSFSLLAMIGLWFLRYYLLLVGVGLLFFLLWKFWN